MVPLKQLDNSVQMTSEGNVQVFVEEMQLRRSEQLQWATSEAHLQLPYVFHSLL